MHRSRRVVEAAAVALLVAVPAELQGQRPLPLEPARAAGLAVSPIFEGWYQNPDGTYSLSFGYLNRNHEEVVEVPAGPQNSIRGGEPAPGLPTHFLPRRHYGVFTVTVPATFRRTDEVVWTLDVRGRSFAIPGRLNPLYEIDALGAPATGDSPPGLQLDEGGPVVHGPHGAVIGPLDATRGEPLSLTVRATDDDDTVTLRWTRWSGPGDVHFDPSTLRADEVTGEATTTATFEAPGDYVLYVRANTSGLSSAGHEQCCWTNGYVKVAVIH